MKQPTEEEFARTLAHIREALAECDRAHTEADQAAARLLLKNYVDSLTPVQQYQLLAAHL